MKILKVIHGYPLRFNAGSEVYSQLLCNELSKQHEIQVFTRQENPFIPDYEMTQDIDHLNDKIILNLINIARPKDRFINQEVDEQFGKLLDQFEPDIVHIGHLNHLSLTLVMEAKIRQIPTVFTIHDFWMMCPRGQFLQFNIGEKNVWQLCDGQNDEKCARKCYSRYFTGTDSFLSSDIKYWSNWVHQRMEKTKEVMNAIDFFLSPSLYLLEAYQSEFKINDNRIKYLDYGFNYANLMDRTRKTEESIVFGYIGTHIPAKGIDYLIKAFEKLRGNAILRIWGRERAEQTTFLKHLAEPISQSPKLKIEWCPEYENSNIVEEVFNHIDVIVTPSIWGENSPLVIHEALQCRIPVITADYGGMKEYVSHMTNGLLFTHRNIEDLTAKMQMVIDDPSLISRLNRGYLQSESGNVVSIEEHCSEIESIYSKLLNDQKEC